MMISVSVLRPLLTLLAVHVFHMGLATTWLVSLAEIGLRLLLFYRRFESGKWAFKKV